MKKNIFYLIAVLAALVGAAFWVMQKPGEQSISVSGGEKFATVDSASVDKVEIKSKTASVTLEKRGAEWFVAHPINYKADQAAATQAVQQVKNLEVKNIVSSKPEKHAVFQVDSSGTEVHVYEKGVEKISFILGKMGNAWNEAYVRKSGSNDVVLAEGASSYAFGKQLRDWRDRTIVTVPREQIKEIKYQFSDTTFVISFVDSTWKIGKEAADGNQVGTLLGSLAGIQADDFVDTTLSPAPKFTAMVAYGGVQLQFAFSKALNKYYVLTSNSPQAFVIEPWRAAQVLKRKKELLAK